jgi:hypothetical protein
MWLISLRRLVASCSSSCIMIAFSWPAIGTVTERVANIPPSALPSTLKSTLLREGARTTSGTPSVRQAIVLTFSRPVSSLQSAFSTASIPPGERGAALAASIAAATPSSDRRRSLVHRLIW